MYKIVYTKKAVKDIEKIKKENLSKKAKLLIDLLRETPYENPPSYEKLKGDLKGAISRRINIKHRLIYQVFEEEKTVKIISLYSHYEI